MRPAAYIASMDERLVPIRGIFRSNEGLFRAALEGVGAPGREAWLARIGEAITSPSSACTSWAPDTTS